MPTQEKHMQKFIKYSLAVSLFVVLLPAMLIGISAALVRDAFMLGYNDLNEKASDWMADDRKKL